MIQDTSKFISLNWNKFLTFQDEKVLIAKRKHRFVLFITIGINILFLLFFLGVSSFLFIGFLHSVILFILSGILACAFWTGFILKSVVEWYFHVYIITNRKILEIKFIPLLTYEINDVLLDQVRCTEVDVKMQGILSKLLDIGSLSMTFDRPTHSEEFVIEDVRHPYEMGIFLSSQLVQQGVSVNSPMPNQPAPAVAMTKTWIKPNRDEVDSEDVNKKKRYNFREEIRPVTVFE